MRYDQYFLMHKNTIAGTMTYDKETSLLINCTIIDKDHAPIGHTDKKAFLNWLDRRALPKHQQGRASLLGDKTNIAYMMENFGLSLTDCYWFKPLDLSLEWKDVNLYTNNFAEIDFCYENKKDICPFKPSATTGGELQKRWVIKNGERCLVKGNYGQMYRQSINESFASLFHEKQGFDHVHYDLIDLPTIFGEGIGCICRDFAGENLEFIPAYDITFFDKKKNDESVLEQYIRACSELGIKKEDMQHWMDYQILSDFLMTNTDRHLLNLGILRDPDTLEFIKPAPIFDTGNSMFYSMNYSPSSVFDIPITSFYKSERKMLDNVKDKFVVDINKLPTKEEIRQLYSKDPYSVVYLDNLLEGFDKKIEMLEAFQQGYSLNPRSNNFYEAAKEDMNNDDYDKE